MRLAGVVGSPFVEIRLADPVSNVRAAIVGSFHLDYLRARRPNVDLIALGNQAEHRQRDPFHMHAVQFQRRPRHRAVKAVVGYVQDVKALSGHRGGEIQHHRNSF